MDIEKQSLTFCSLCRLAATLAGQAEDLEEGNGGGEEVLRGFVRPVWVWRLTINCISRAMGVSRGH